MYRDCCVALPRDDMGLSAVCDCGISLSYSLTIFEVSQWTAWFCGVSMGWLIFVFQWAVCIWLFRGDSLDWWFHSVLKTSVYILFSNQIVTNHVHVELYQHFPLLLLRQQKTRIFTI